MADLIDGASEVAAQFLQSSLTTKRPEGPAPCGFCYNCNEPLAAGLRWCDTDCRDDYEKIEKTRRDLERGG